MIWFISLIIGIAVTSGALGIPGTGAIPWFVPNILWSIAIPSLITGILALVVGIYAVQRKKWGLSLAGSIAAILVFLPLGIVAVVLAAQSKNEFE